MTNPFNKLHHDYFKFLDSRELDITRAESLLEDIVEYGLSEPIDLDKLETAYFWISSPGFFENEKFDSENESDLERQAEFYNWLKPVFSLFEEKKKVLEDTLIGMDMPYERLVEIAEEAITIGDMDIYQKLREKALEITALGYLNFQEIPIDHETFSELIGGDSPNYFQALLSLTDANGKILVDRLIQLYDSVVNHDGIGEFNPDGVDIYNRIVSGILNLGSASDLNRLDKIIFEVEDYQLAPLILQGIYSSDNEQNSSFKTSFTKKRRNQVKKVKGKPSAVASKIFLDSLPALNDYRALKSNRVNKDLIWMNKNGFKRLKEIYLLRIKSFNIMYRHDLAE